MNYKKTTLKNGLRIVTVPMKETQTVTVVVMVGVGSRYETEKEAGLSHFIEHMFFKGTEKRPTTLDISTELDSIGGEYNAFTSKDRTGYFAKVDARHVDTAIDVVFDMFLNSKIEEEEIKKESGTILQELNMYEDTPMRNVGDVFEGLLYPKNPLGRDIIGYKKTIKSFKRNDFLEYMKKFYRSNDTVIAVAGKFKEKETVEKIKKYFSGMEQGEKPKTAPVSDKQSGPQVKIKYKKTDQTNFILGVRAYDQNHKDRYALSLLSVILGGGMSSRLFTEVREKRGLAYYVRTIGDTFADVGYVATQAGVEHKNLELAISTILGEYKKTTREKVSRKELQKAKDFIKGGAVMGMEASDEVAMFFIDQEMAQKKIMTLEEKFKLIDKVTEEDIARVAKDIFQNKKLNLAVIGPHKNREKLRKMLKL
ncbi:MAG: pitrilysin family protein [Candidatus Pacebacteria bacterium]|nr:pitrilysin family protein [Candidatus Paceibacterota bacterium]MDR3582852.1 pitrilysin family protein [Candidatus Paceibacterota bacterium]